MEPTFEYDHALYCTLWGHWDDLISIMTKTKDDLLSKKIESFITHLHSSMNEQEVLGSRNTLLHYIDHAMHQAPLPEITMR